MPKMAAAPSPFSPSTLMATGTVCIVLLAACISLYLDGRSLRSRLSRLEEFEALSNRKGAGNFYWVKDPDTLPIPRPSHQDADIGQLRDDWEQHLNLRTPLQWQEGVPQNASDIDCSVDVVVSHKELAKWSDGVALGRALERLHECGVVYLDDLFEAQFVDTLRAFYEEFVNTPQAKDFRYPCQGEGRIEHMMPFSPPFNTSQTAPFGDRRLREIISKFLGPPFKLELMTVINSRPGSGNQRWHQGWRYLFHEAERLPPYAVVVTVPLDDVTIDMGGTQFCPRKKMRFYHGWRCDDDYVQAATTKGTVVVFDYKTLHRGPGNLGERDRPMISMVFSKSFFFNTEAYVNRGITNLASLHQKRYMEQWYWHPTDEAGFFKV